MRRRFSWGSIAVALVLQTLMLTGVVASEPGMDFSEALRFRAEFGLPAGEAYVKAVAARSDVSLAWGVPLTPAEAAEMDRRARLADGMEALNARAATIPELGAVYFDQRAGGEIVVAIAGDPAPHRAALSRLAPEGASVRMERVAYSLRQLLDTQAAILGDRDELSSAGIVINSVTADESGNRVEVGVDGDLTAAAAFLSERYGMTIHAFAGGAGHVTACTDRYNCVGPPLRGGIASWTPGAANATCSFAFIVNQAGTQRMLTAGHNPCGIAGQYKHDGHVVGTQKTRSWFAGDGNETADAATVGDLTDTQDSRWLMMSCGGCYMTMLGAQGADNENIPVCLSARMAVGIRCGTMINKNVGICFDEGCLLAQREATYSIWVGDSGGAAFSQTGHAYGVQSSCIDRTGDGACSQGNTADNALYSHIQNVFVELGGNMSIYTGG
ncbi:MAG TPA: hypothetical protein VHR55_07965 [Candidatus Limnocylindria bacterium]|nr:hypothetical protein [Candidatus Limnocylindria bacterium]